MKHVVGITVVKNESDIIESFVRHTLAWCDALIICDDQSSDRTGEIIDSLAKEGLNVQKVTIPMPITGFHQASITNNLKDMAINKLKADIVCPLDADEFLMPAPVHSATQTLSVRDILENLPEGDCTYGAVWTHFIPTQFSREDNAFLPIYFEQYYCPSARNKDFDKVIAHSSLIESASGVFNTGNHGLYSRGKILIEKKEIPELMLAHLPNRSVNQAMTKAIKFIANCLSMPRAMKKDHATIEAIFRNPLSVYKEIKERGYLTSDYLQTITMNSYVTDPKTPLLGYKWDCAHTLRYTDYERSNSDIMRSILTHYENIIEKLLTVIRAYDERY